MNKKTIFVDLTEENFQREVLDSEQLVLVKIGADWLGTCDIMAPILEELHAVYKEQIKYGSIDVDLNNKLAGEYGVTKLPAFIFFKFGEAVGHIVGAAPKAKFIAMINDLL